MTEIELDVSKKAKPGKNNNKAPKECQGIYQCTDSITHLNGRWKWGQEAVLYAGIPTVSYCVLGARELLFFPGKSKIF